MADLRNIHVQLLRHDPTGLLLARSDDLYGLALHGHSVKEIGDRLPGVIRDLLEAEGHKVGVVTMAQNLDRLANAGWGLPSFVASAELGDHRR